MFVPTIVFFNPDKQKFAHLIGKFDKETIQEHESKFLQGRLPTFEMKTGSAINIKDLKCQEIQIEGASVEGSDIDDEILREILDEEKQKKSSKDCGEKIKKKKKSHKKKAKKNDL